MPFDFGRTVKQSVVFILYLGLTLILCASVIQEGGEAYAGDLGAYVATLIVAFGIFTIILQKYTINAASSGTFKNSLLNRTADVLLAAAAAFVVVHILWLGHIPLVTGASINDYYDVMRVRQGIFFDALPVFRYGPNLLLKSLFPFLILYFYVVGRRVHFWCAVVIATLYGAALMNKMFIVIPIAPIFLLLIMRRKIFLAASILALPVAMLAILVFVQNPHTRPTFWTAPEDATASGKPLIIERSVTASMAANMTADMTAEKMTEKMEGMLGVKLAANIDGIVFPAFQFFQTIYIRIFVIPGQVVKAWFNNIPSNLPYANGCGYRWASGLLGCEFRFIPQLIHDIENPALVAEGIKGTMTAANFMEDYANFGRWGLIFSGIFMGFLLSLIGAIYRKNWRSALLLNLIPVMMLIELPLSTILWTGGWAVTTLLYLVFRERMGNLELTQ